jgi:bacteriocin biosynthesis cyclodehydratase domain-containing protein
VLVAVTALDGFGSAVADAIERGRTHPGFSLADGPEAQLTVVCSGRELPLDVAEECDRRAFVDGHFWLAVVNTHPNLRIGPLIGPDAEWCFTCLRRRSLQHHPDPALLQGLLDAYDGDGRWGPRGHLLLHAELAAAAVTRYIRGARDGACAVKSVATVVWLNVLRHEVSQDRLVGVHGCPRCASAAKLGSRLTDGLSELALEGA